MSLTTPSKIRELQIKLYRKAKNEPAYRFYMLYDKIYREDILAHAYALARANQGAPGVDGQTFERIESAGVEEAHRHPTGVTQQDVSTTAGAEGNDPEARRRGAATRDSDGQRELHQSAIRIWDGRRSVIRSIRFAASAFRF